MSRTGVSASAVTGRAVSGRAVSGRAVNGRAVKRGVATLRSLSCAAIILCVLGVSPPDAHALDWPGRSEAARTAFHNADNAEERATALDAVNTTTDPVAAEVLLEALRDRSPLVRAAACLALERAGGPLAHSWLIDRLGDRDTQVRVAAASAIGQLEAISAVEPLSRLLTDPEPDVRVAVVEALAALPDATAGQFLLQAVRDSDRDVAVAALNGIAARAERSALPAVLARVDDPSRDVALAAVRAAGTLGGADQTMLRLARYGTPLIAAAALRSLHHSTSPEVVRFLAALGTEAADASVRLAALEALNATAGPAAIGVLEPSLVGRSETPTAESDLIYQYFATVGPEAWPVLESAASQHLARERLWHAWLRSGDAAAVRAVLARDELSGEESVALLRSSPLPEAFCAASTLGLPLEADAQLEWARWVYELGAPSCLDLTEVQAGWSSRAQLWVALALIESDSTLAAEFSATLDPGSQEREDLVAFFSTLGTAGQDVRSAVASWARSDDPWLQRELATVSLQLYAEGVPGQRAAAERRLGSTVVLDVWEALRCTESSAVAATTRPPNGVEARRAWAVRALACGLPPDAAFEDLSHDPAVAVAQITVASADTLQRALDEPAYPSAVRANALVRLATMDAESAIAAAEAHLTSRVELLRAAAWSIVVLSESTDPLERIRLQLRTERSSVVVAVLAGRWAAEGGAAGEFAGLARAATPPHLGERDYPYSVVSVHDFRTGTAAYDAIVVVVEQSGQMTLQATDLNGIGVVRSRDARAVFAVALGQNTHAAP